MEQKLAYGRLANRWVTTAATLDRHGPAEQMLGVVSCGGSQSQRNDR